MLKHLLELSLVLMAPVVHLIATRLAEKFANDLLFGFALSIRLERANHDDLDRLGGFSPRIIAPRGRGKVAKRIRTVLIGLLVEELLARLIMLRLLF